LTAGAQTTDNVFVVIQSNFARWDLNHDGILSTNELDMAVANPQTTNQNAAARHRAFFFQVCESTAVRDE
jgi:hypothetical protein